MHVRTLPAPLDWHRLLLWAGLAVVAIPNLVMVGLTIALIATGSDAADWSTYVAAADHYADGTLYEPNAGGWWYNYRYSPLLVYPLQMLGFIGVWAWRGLHLVALLGLPHRARLLALASYPFWFDVAAGNLLIFVVVLAYHALRGNRWAIGGFLLLALLIPRPLMLPLALWLLWKQPAWRWPFAAALVVSGLAVLATGYADEWAVRLATSGGEELSSIVNIGPSILIGWWWMVAALPLSVLAFWRGYPATAGLLLQPYWLPYYVLMPLADRLYVSAQRSAK